MTAKLATLDAAVEALVTYQRLPEDRGPTNLYGVPAVSREMLEAAREHVARIDSGSHLQERELAMGRAGRDEQIVGSPNYNNRYYNAFIDAYNAFAARQPQN